MARTTHRVFIAIDLPAAHKDQIEHLRRRLEPRLSRLRWTRPDQLHLTLAFLGDVSVQAVPALRRELTGAVAGCAPFPLRLEGLGAFPNLQRPRVLWTGVTGPGLPALESLRQRVVAACRAAGCPPADDRFRPHITLGRFRDSPARQPALELAAETAFQTPPFPVESIAAYASELLPQGPAYTHLSHFSLKSSDRPPDA